VLDTTPRTRLRPLLVGLLVMLAFFAGMWALSRNGYPGGPDECIALGDCYCEAIGPGIAAQPANSWSNLGFAAVGLLVLADAGRRRRGTSRLAGDDRYVLLYGAVGVFLGLGSFAFHGSIRAWGGYVDVLSMHAFLAFILAYDLARIHDKAWSWFSAWFVALLIAFSAAIYWLPPEHGKTLFAGFVGVTLLVEAAVSYPRLRPWSPVRIAPRRLPWFWAGLGSFAVANVIWNLSRTGGVWCNPLSLIQGHAVWHLLSAVSVGCFYRYLRDEGPTPAMITA
jgi:hypothetical protein